MYGSQVRPLEAYDVEYAHLMVGEQTPSYATRGCMPATCATLSTGCVFSLAPGPGKAAPASSERDDCAGPDVLR